MNKISIDTLPVLKRLFPNAEYYSVEDGWTWVYEPEETADVEIKGKRYKQTATNPIEYWREQKVSI